MACTEIYKTGAALGHIAGVRCIVSGAIFDAEALENLIANLKALYDTGA